MIQTLNIAYRVLLALILAAVVLFCPYGFLATYEYPDLRQRLPWQVFYGGTALACLSAIVFQVRRGNIAFRVFTTVLLVSLVLTCAFEFVATLEYFEPRLWLRSQAVCGGTGLACIIAIAFVSSRQTIATTHGRDLRHGKARDASFLLPPEEREKLRPVGRAATHMERVLKSKDSLDPSLDENRAALFVDLLNNGRRVETFVC